MRANSERLPHRRWSVVVRAAKVIPALRAHQLAMVPRQPMRAVGTNLAMMVHARLIRPIRAGRTGM
jgi:hypothetical protein